MRSLTALVTLATFAANVKGQNSTVGPTSTKSINVPKSQPQFARKLSPYLASMSIELDRWPDWAGGQVGKPNTFLNTALANLKSRTGSSTWFRIGGDSQDNAILDTTLQVFSTTPGRITSETPYPEAWGVYIGRDFYALSQNLPAGTQFTWGLNLRSLNKTETVSQAALIADTFQGSRAKELKNHPLRSVEVGNEPDRFNSTSIPSYINYTDWTLLNYTNTWIEHARGVIGAMDFSKGLKLQAGAFSGGGTWTTFNPTGVLEDGLLDAPDLKSVKTVWSHHAYQGAFGTGFTATPGQLMSKQSLRQNATLRLNDVRVTEQYNLDNIWGETNSYAHHGAPGTSNTAESAIWAVDYMLYSATLGFSRTHFHNGYGYRYNVIQPFTGVDDGTNTTDRPHIMPLYHAFLIISEAIGNSGDSLVAEISTESSTLAAYGIWEKDALRRVVVINSAVYAPDVGSGLPRPQVKVVLQGVQAGLQGSLKLLHAPATDAYHGITWGGQNFDTESAVPSGNVVTTPITNGTFVMEASSVALVSFA